MKEAAFVYAFLSRIYERPLGQRELEDLRNNPAILEQIGQQSLEYLQGDVFEELEVDFTTIFDVNAVPVESAVIDNKEEILVGLQNPVMFFYFEHGYEVNMNQTKILAPDHLAIELGFMQALSYRGEDRIAAKFLSEHLMQWVPPYLMAVEDMAQTPFYKEIADFTIDFLCSEYERLVSG